LDIAVLAIRVLQTHLRGILMDGQIRVSKTAAASASMNTTEKTYLHIIQELENKDVDLVMRSLTSLV
jgi:hypothetical protein